MAAIFGPGGPIILPWTVWGDHFRGGTVHGVTGQEKSCKKQLVGITTFEVAVSVVELAADVFSLCVQERSQTLTGQPGDHAHWVKRVSSLYNIEPPPLVVILSVVGALW